MSFALHRIALTALALLGAACGASQDDNEAARDDTVATVGTATGDVALNRGWRYIESSAPDPAALGTAGTGEAVDLPHTWNAFDATDAEPGYRRGVGWYRKVIRFDGPAAGRNFILRFEGANMKTGVYVNGKRAGGHVGGYLGFTVDITPFVRAAAANEILVRVDNGVDRHLIPSQKSDFVLYGGITRDVRLEIRPAFYIESLQIDTPRVSAARAAMTVVAAFGGDGRDSETARGHRLHVTLRDPAGVQVAGARSPADGEPGALRVALPEVAEPALWSPASPALYTVTARLTDAAGNEVQTLEERAGFRFYEFGADGEFRLNGERLLLRGTHRHEEHAGYGAAMPDELHVRDMEMIKELGANFVRLAHYPQDPSVYEAADRLGLILWDELPWCRGGMGGAEWQANTENMLREMIARNRNHPSVFFWSLGNEIYWLPDFEGGGDEQKLNAYLARLNDIAHELDPSRMTAIRKYYPGADVVDVFSPSIWAGWYGGGYHQYADALAEAQRKYPRLLHMEYGGSSHVGRHVADPPGGDGLRGGQTSVAELVNQSGVVSVARYGDWSESYIVDLFDWHLSVSESQPGFAGNAQWAFKDFATPLRPENPIPYVNQKGLVDRQGRPKEAYWVFRSYWSSDPAFCRIYGHSWTERRGQAGRPQHVRVYCNTDTAELTVNGESQGEKTREPGTFPAGGLSWEVRFGEGANTLAVTGRNGGEAAATDRLEVEFTTAAPGETADIRLRAKPAADGRVLIEATAVDEAGRRVHDSRERVYFSHTNEGTGGRLLAAYGTPHGSAVIELANGRAGILFEPSGDGIAVIEVRSQEHKGSYIRIPGPQGPESAP